jgi:CDK-activating kinase assembly factor MAT1
VLLKKRGQQARHLVAEAAADVTGGAGKLSIRGLKEKRKAAPVSDGPYDPFGGTDFVPDRYKLHDTFTNTWLDGARLNTAHAVGGYDVREYYARSMFDAFAGFAVFIDDEKETGVGMSAGEVATIGASMAADTAPSALAMNATKMEVDSLFA